MSDFVSAMPDMMTPVDPVAAMSAANARLLFKRARRVARQIRAWVVRALGAGLVAGVGMLLTMGAPVHAQTQWQGQTPALDPAQAQAQSGAQPSSAPAEVDDSLYQALGARPGLVKIVDGMMTHVLADPRTNPYFENASIKRIKQKLVEQFCVLSGGPCTYTGREMKRAHAGEKITAEAFNALVEDLQKSMDENGIPFHTQNKLLAKLAPMYRQIVEQP